MLCFCLLKASWKKYTKTWSKKNKVHLSKSITIKFSPKVQQAVVERYFTPLWEVALFSARNLLVKVFNPCMTLCGG